MYVLQRVTGIVAFVFIGYHLYEYRIQKWLFGMRSEAFYGTLSAHLSSTTAGVPWLAVFYLIGIASAVFHFTNGLWGFCFSWGLTVTRRAQRRAAVLFLALGVVLFLLGANTVIFFATGSRFFVPSDLHSTKAAALPCPVTDK
jgi:succinate dehydrogenase/fumarate reductase cytochrome b subunit